MKRSAENELVKAALEANKERKIWQAMAWFSMSGAIVSTIGFILAVKGGV